MARDHTERTAPDLFPTTTASASPAPKATTEGEPQRHVLPKNLPNAIKHLSDAELDFLHATTLDEMKRRGRKPKGVETDLQTLRNRFDIRPDLKKQPSEAPRLAQGKFNAVHAAFKAGVTPSRIAKQFGISQSDVRKALASDERKR